MIFNLLRRNKPSPEEEQKRRRNARILDYAIEQRSKVHIKFDEESTNLTGITGTILAMNETGLVLEIGGVNSLQDRFLGKKINCFFKIIEKEARHREFFYSFNATVLRIKIVKEKFLHIAVNFPLALTGTQRRKSLRMKPDLEQFSHIALWRYDAAGGFDITKPTVSYQHFKGSLSSVENMSAGGLRILIRRPVLKEKELQLFKGDRFIMFLTFADVMPKLRSEYWLVCKINNIQRDPVSGDATLGMEFIANGVRKEEAGKVEWTKIADNVIDDLAQRIYQWHMSLYRDKGLA